MRKLLKYMTFYDKILIISIIVISLVFIAYPFINMLKNEDNNNRFIIIQSSQGIEERIPLSKTYENNLIFEVEGPIGTSIVEAKEGRVRLKKAPPKDPLKTCEKTGWISSPGPVIVCVPNQISIWIEDTKTDFDGVSW